MIAKVLGHTDEAFTAVDTVIAIFIQPLTTGTDEVAAAVHRAATSTQAASVPILGVFMHRGEPPPALAGDEVRVPAYPSTEDAVRALAHAVRHARRRAEPPSAPPAVDMSGFVASGLQPPFA